MCTIVCVCVCVSAHVYCTIYATKCACACTSYGIYVSSVLIFSAEVSGWINEIFRCRTLERAAHKRYTLKFQPPFALRTYEIGPVGNFKLKHIPPPFLPPAERPSKSAKFQLTRQFYARVCHVMIKLFQSLLLATQTKTKTHDGGPKKRGSTTQDTHNTQTLDKTTAKHSSLKYQFSFF